MSGAAQYALQVLFWIALMAGLGLAARPLIDRIDNRGDQR